MSRLWAFSFEDAVQAQTGNLFVNPNRGSYGNRRTPITGQTGQGIGQAGRETNQTGQGTRQAGQETGQTGQETGQTGQGTRQAGRETRQQAKKMPDGVWIQFSDAQGYLAKEQELFKILAGSHGDTDVVIFLRDTRAIKILPKNLRVKADADLQEKLSAGFGKENVKIITKPIEKQ